MEERKPSGQTTEEPKTKEQIAQALVDKWTAAGVIVGSVLVNKGKLEAHFQKTLIPAIRAHERWRLEGIQRGLKKGTFRF